LAFDTLPVGYRFANAFASFEQHYGPPQAALTRINECLRESDESSVPDAWFLEGIEIAS
jgi:hypothetical protein